MEWFKIDWNGPYPVESAHARKEASNYGIYAMYEVSTKTPKLLYIGETYRQSLGARLKQHKKQWLFRVNGKVVIHFGTIKIAQGKRISSSMVFDVEGLLIHVLVPPYNTVSKHGYSGRDIILINTGKTGTLPPIMGERELVTILRDMMKSQK